MLLRILFFKRCKEKLRFLITCILFILSSSLIGVRNAHGENAVSHSDSLVAPQWRLTVSDPHYPIRPGLTIIYVITYENTGNTPATNATLVSIIDPMTEYLLSTGAGTYDPNSLSVTWTLETVEPQTGGRFILRVKTQEDIPHGTEVVNTTTISCTEGIRSDTTLITPVTYLTILKIYKTTPVTFAHPGQEIVYDLHYANIGDTSATNVLLTDPLPEQTSFVSCTQGCLLDSSGENISWEIGDVQPGSLFACQLTVRIDSTFSGASFINNKATISCAEESTDSSFCTTPVDTTATTSGAPALSFFIRSRDHFVSAGNEVLYRVHCENVGREAAHALIITNPIPEHTEYVNCGNNGQYDSSTEKVTWFTEVLERHQEMTVTLTVRVENPLPHRTPIVNRASIICTEGFSASAVETTIVLSAPKWDLFTWASPQTIIPGQPITFSTRLRNRGSMSAKNTVIFNPIPLHTFYVSNTNEGNFNTVENGVTWHIGPLNVNDESTVDLTVTFHPAKATVKEIVNIVYVQSEEAIDSISISIPVVLPQSYQLGQNYPNPFNQNTIIPYRIPTNEFVILKVYNTLGQEVKTLVEGLTVSGSYTLTWDGKDNKNTMAESGVYLYRLSTGNNRWVDTKRMVLIR